MCSALWDHLVEPNRMDIDRPFAIQALFVYVLGFEIGAFYALAQRCLFTSWEWPEFRKEEIRAMLDSGFYWK